MLTNCALEKYGGVHEKIKLFSGGHDVLLGDKPSLRLSVFINWEFSDPLKNIEHSWLRQTWPKEKVLIIYFKKFYFFHQGNEVKIFKG